MSEKEILQDIVAYCPAVAGVNSAMTAKEIQQLIGNYTIEAFFLKSIRSFLSVLFLRENILP